MGGGKQPGGAVEAVHRRQVFRAAQFDIIDGGETGRGNFRRRIDQASGALPAP